MLSTSYLKIKVILLLFMLFIIVTAFAQPQTTIIDSVYTEGSLQAVIGYVFETSQYYASILPRSEYELYPGDFRLTEWPMGDNFNAGYRFYLSFEVLPVPVNYSIQSVVFKLYQYFCEGDSYSQTFPLFYGNHYDCMVNHVNYGNSIEVSDFDPFYYGTVGAISTDNTVGWKTLDITDEYIQDFNQNRPYSQYMIYFPIISDADFQFDNVRFGSLYFTDGQGFPQVVITYQNTNSDVDEISIHRKDSVFPNPCDNYVYISAGNQSKVNKASLYNLKGQSLKTHLTRESNLSEVIVYIDETLPRGIYCLKYTIEINGKQYEKSEKILKR